MQEHIHITTSSVLRLDEARAASRKKGKRGSGKKSTTPTIEQVLTILTMSDETCGTVPAIIIDKYVLTYFTASQ